MGCGHDVMKYLLFLFNVLFWIAGGALLGIGIYLIAANNIEAVVDIAGLSFYYSGCYVLIAVGSFMFLVGFCGCCGAIKENKCLLGTYFVFLLVIFVIQLAIGIWALVSQQTIENQIEAELNKTIPMNFSDAASTTLVAIQESFKCCGPVNGCQDWFAKNATGCGCTRTADNNATCGAVGTTGCTAADGATHIYTEGCFPAILDFINDNIAIIAGVGLGIGLAEIFGMIFAICLCRGASKGYETY